MHSCVRPSVVLVRAPAHESCNTQTDRQTDRPVDRFTEGRTQSQQCVQHRQTEGERERERERWSKIDHLDATQLSPCHLCMQRLPARPKLLGTDKPTYTNPPTGEARRDEK
mmetsp:Transcript_46866/g.116823  ORF Transcript_46866/g.116823 Transcript_46866/m.116823 type:complete len:111 (-) Transcript_46866:375-707(-)